MRKIAIAVGLTVALGTAVPIHADPVEVVTGGHYNVNFDDPGDWLLTGNGFVLMGEGLGTVLPFWDCGLCAPGTPISLDAVLLPGDFNWGRAEVNGTNYGDLYWTGRFDFESGTVAAGAGVTGYRPFTFTGNLTAFQDQDRSGPALFSVSLVGSGLATLDFYPELSNGGAEVLNIRYDFADQTPVPEPATLALVAGGLAAVARTRARARRTSA